MNDTATVREKPYDFGNEFYFNVDFDLATRTTKLYMRGIERPVHVISHDDLETISRVMTEYGAWEEQVVNDAAKHSTIMPEDVKNYILSRLDHRLGKTPQHGYWALTRPNALAQYQSGMPIEVAKWRLVLAGTPES